MSFFFQNQQESKNRLVFDSINKLLEGMVIALPDGDLKNEIRNLQPKIRAELEPDEDILEFEGHDFAFQFTDAPTINQVRQLINNYRLLIPDGLPLERLRSREDCGNWLFNEVINTRRVRNADGQEEIQQVPENWRFCAFDGTLSPTERQDCIVYLNVEKRLPDWLETMRQVAELVRTRNLTERVTQKFLLELVNVFANANSKILQNKNSNEIARFLIQSQARLDKKQYQLREIYKIRREPGETFLSVLDRVKALSTQVYDPETDVGRDKIKTMLKKAIISYAHPSIKPDIEKSVGRSLQDQTDINIDSLITSVNRHEAKFNLEIDKPMAFQNEGLDDPKIYMTYQNTYDENVNKLKNKRIKALKYPAKYTGLDIDDPYIRYCNRYEPQPRADQDQWVPLRIQQAPESEDDDEEDGNVEPAGPQPGAVAAVPQQERGVQAVGEMKSLTTAMGRMKLDSKRKADPSMFKPEPASSRSRETSPRPPTKSHISTGAKPKQCADPSAGKITLSDEYREIENASRADPNLPRQLRPESAGRSTDQNRIEYKRYERSRDNSHNRDYRDSKNYHYKSRDRRDRDRSQSYDSRQRQGDNRRRNYQRSSSRGHRRSNSRNYHRSGSRDYRRSGSRDYRRPESRESRRSGSRHHKRYDRRDSRRSESSNYRRNGSYRHRSDSSRGKYRDKRSNSRYGYREDRKENDKYARSHSRDKHRERSRERRNQDSVRCRDCKNASHYPYPCPPLVNATTVQESMKTKLEDLTQDLNTLDGIVNRNK